MTSSAFFDTNVLVYLLADDAKSTRSRELLGPSGTISVQVLSEFISVAIGKRAMDWDELEHLLDGFRTRLKVEPLTLETQIRATALARRYRLRIYDAMILAAAELAGCDTVYSEDMQDGMRIGGLTIRNPFA